MMLLREFPLMIKAQKVIHLLCEAITRCCVLYLISRRFINEILAANEHEIFLTKSKELKRNNI